VIAIIDYGAGNIASVKKALEFIGGECVLTGETAKIAAAERIVLPGVGHFATMRALERSGLNVLLRRQIAGGKPFLGICLGMQWLFAGSDEAPDIPALRLLPGICERFPAGTKSPHVGWNTVRQRGESRLLRATTDSSFFYFTHSYRAPISEATVGVSEHGGVFSAAVERGNTFGVQFHPEKSGAAGLQVLRNFCETPC